MSSLTKLASKLPGDIETNGLDHWVGQFRREPHTQVVGIVYFDVAKLITDYDKSEIQPVLSVAAIEILGPSADIPQAVQDAYEAARDRRLHRQDKLPTDTAPTQPEVLCTCGHPADDHDDDGHCTITIDDPDGGDELACACVHLTLPGEALAITDGVDVDATMSAYQRAQDGDVVDADVVDDDPEAGIEP